jgi:S-adenosylmethionine hydrolase
LKLGRPVEIELGTRATHQAHFALTFADVQPDKLLLYEDAQRWLAVAVSHGSAAMRLGVSVDDELRITPQ